MRRALLFAVFSILMIIIDVLFLRVLGPMMPSLLVVVILIAAYQSFRLGLWLALLSGVLIDVLSLLPFGMYIFISLGMFALAKTVHLKGLALPRLLNVFLLTLGMITWQYSWLWVFNLLLGWTGEGVLLLVFYLSVQVLLTSLLAYWTLRRLNVQ